LHDTDCKKDEEVVEKTPAIKQVIENLDGFVFRPSLFSFHWLGNGNV
jgi:predicted alpha/beta-fold hydrolase